MIDQSLEVSKLLTELKNVGFPTSKVEEELPISSGYLYKVKTGKKFLTEEKLEDLRKYHSKNCKKVVHQAPGVAKTKINISKDHPVVTKIEIKEPKPGSLADMMRQIRSEPKRAVAEPYQRKKY